MPRKSVLLQVPVMLVFACAAAAQDNYEPSHSFDSSEGFSALEYHDGELPDGDCGCKKRCRRVAPMAKRRGEDSQWLWDSCNCNGSFKFPVPPLYTYHWPGLYAHQLMTDYQSPWRFPAIRPYKEEAPGDELSEVVPPRQSAGLAPKADPRSWPSGVEPVSQKVMRLYR